jgi:hypothetical protein
MPGASPGEKQAILAQRKYERSLRDGVPVDFRIKVPMADITIHMKGPDYARVPAPAPPQTGSDTPDYVDPLIGVTLSGGRTIVSATPANLQDKLNAAVAGETIELASGTYSGSFTQPIPLLLRAQLILRLSVPGTGQLVVQETLLLACFLMGLLPELVLVELKIILLAIN